MRNSVLEALPGRRRNGYIIGVVNAPVGAGKNLLREIRINNDRIHRDIWKIARLICPRERAAVGSAGYLENMTRRGGRIRVESADRCIADREIGGGHRRIEAMPSTGRFGKSVLFPVTSTQFACD